MEAAGLAGGVGSGLDDTPDLNPNCSVCLDQRQALLAELRGPSLWAWVATSGILAPTQLGRRVLSFSGFHLLFVVTMNP